MKVLEPNDVRALLFASAVILFEGSTELGALPRWWASASSAGLPDPNAANIAFVDVGGDSSFGSYVEYLNAFDVPWAIVTDGPALRPLSTLARQLTKLELASVDKPHRSDDQAFEEWRRYWAKVGVFTVATVFGDDSSKQGEFEAFLKQLDADLLAQAQELYPRSKPRVGAYFATKHSQPPIEIFDLYRNILERFPHISVIQTSDSPLPVHQQPS
jgi:hypothetical protein